jgi:ATP/maltotriose-dependent transcriptional regulator MalT
MPVELQRLFQAAITEDTSLPIMVARSQLSYGLWLRRQRRIAESREPLRAARDSFQAMGATPLVKRASRELRASGESSPKRLPRASDRLTPQELQIAQMAAAGMSNPRIRAELRQKHTNPNSELVGGPGFEPGASRSRTVSAACPRVSRRLL